MNPNSRAVSETAALCPSSMDPLITNGSSSLNDLDDISVSSQNLLKEDDINEDLLLKESSPCSCIPHPAKLSREETVTLLFCKWPYYIVF